jgi:DNA-binding GntR family transcriptional regulator
MNFKKEPLFIPSEEKGANAALPLQERVYALIKEEIVNCKMLPGSVISEDTLIEKYKTSRTPIREALLKLQREGLVDIFPRQGTFVSQISLKDIYDIYQLRLILEPQVIKIVCRSLDAAALAKFRDFFVSLENRECSRAEWFSQDREMHCYIMNASGNSHLRDIFASIMDQNMRMRIIAGKIPSRMRDTNHEHIGILDALLAGDTEKAAELMGTHIISSRNAALKLEEPA